MPSIKVPRDVVTHYFFGNDSFKQLNYGLFNSQMGCYHWIFVIMLSTKNSPIDRGEQFMKKEYLLDDYQPINGNSTIREAIQILKNGKKKYLLVDSKQVVSKDKLLDLYCQSVPVETPLNVALADEGSSFEQDNNFFLQIIEALPHSLYVVDSNGNPVYANNAFIQAIGLSREQVLSQNISSLKDSKIFYPAITPIVLHEKRTITINQQLKNGQNTLVTGIPIFNSDGTIRWVVTISQEKTVEKYLAVNKQLKYPYENFVFKSKQMKEIIDIVDQVANVDSTVLITGESGVGKDMIARLIHQESKRADEPFLQLNCGAIPEPLLESELFGYNPGAFSGADKRGKKGLIEAANNGTLFLDEIGEMPLQLQVKLLQFLQKREIIRLGSTTPVKVNVRIIAATNRDLQEDVRAGKFRLDLFYRLNVIPINIPPLRERPEDILPLSHYFLDKFNKKYNKQIKLSKYMQKELLSSTWPGNIRELENFIERLVVLNKDAESLFNSNKKILNDHTISSSRNPIIVNDILPLKKAIEMLEAELIKKAANIEKNSYKIASLLKISQSSAHRKMKKYL